jgi:hypothetical protein
VKLPRYPLQVVFDQRQRAQDEAQQAVAERLAELARAEAERERARLARESAEAAAHEARSRLYDPDPDGRFDVHLVEERKIGLRFRDQEVGAAREAETAAAAGVTQAAAAVEAAREALAEAARERMAIEKHRETWSLEVRAELARKEEGLIAEVANASWVRNREEAE